MLFPDNHPFDLSYIAIMHLAGKTRVQEFGNRTSPPTSLRRFRLSAAKTTPRLGEYNTKRTILEMYDEVPEAIHTGQSYQSRLAPSYQRTPMATSSRWPNGIAITGQSIFIRGR